MEENGNVAVNLDMFNLLKLISYNGNKEKIEKDSQKLYEYVINYLKQLGANEKFLDKPGVIERVKYIIFYNLFLEENTKVKSKGIVNKKDENCFKEFSVLSDGSIIFFNKKYLESQVFCIEELNDEVVCKYMKLSDDKILEKEERIILDEFGFDKKYFEILSTEDNEVDNQAFREQFKNLIDIVNGDNVIFFSDLGDFSVNPHLDLKKLCDLEIPKELKYYKENLNYIGMVEEYEDDNFACPWEPEEISEEEIDILKQNYKYYTSAYPNTKQWYVNRYGKRYLKEVLDIEVDDSMDEKNIFDKILEANSYEVTCNYDKFNFSVSKIKLMLKMLYDKNEYEKAFAIFRNLPEEKKIKFIQECCDCDLAFLEGCISNLENDDDKLEWYREHEDELNDELELKLMIIASFNDENEKVELFEELVDEIIENDLDAEEEEEYCSEIVLDSLNEDENLKKFLYLFKDVNVYCEKYLEVFSEEEIVEYLEEVEDNLSLDDYVEFIRTKKLSDDYILNLLEENWTDDFEEISWSIFKLCALTNLKDENRMLEFIEEKKDFFNSEEMLVILLNIGDEEILEKFKKKYKNRIYTFDNEEHFSEFCEKYKDCFDVFDCGIFFDNEEKQTDENSNGDER